MKGSNLLFLPSWVILLVLAIAILLISVQSLRVAITSRSDALTPEYTIKQITEQGGESAANAFRGRRITAATWAMGYALLAIGVTWMPYRRGEKWAWWALFVSLGLSQFTSLGRAVIFGTTAGTSASATVLAIALLGLLAGTPRIFGKRAPEI